VINVSQIITIDKSLLTEKIHQLPNNIIMQIDEGLKLVLKL
jgi:mRNA interferase MazF